MRFYFQQLIIRMVWLLGMGLSFVNSSSVFGQTDVFKRNVELAKQRLAESLKDDRSAFNKTQAEELAEDLAIVYSSALDQRGQLLACALNVKDQSSASAETFKLCKKYWPLLQMGRSTSSMWAILTLGLSGGLSLIPVGLYGLASMVEGALYPVHWFIWGSAGVVATATVGIPSLVLHTYRNFRQLDQAFRDTLRNYTKVPNRNLELWFFSHQKSAFDIPIEAFESRRSLDNNFNLYRSWLASLVRIASRSAVNPHYVVPQLKQIAEIANRKPLRSHRRQLKSLINGLAKVQNIIRENDWHHELGSEFYQPFGDYKLETNLKGSLDKALWNTRNFEKTFLKQHLNFEGIGSEELFNKYREVFMGSEVFADLFFDVAFQNKGLQIKVEAINKSDGTDIVISLSLIADSNASAPVEIKTYVYDNKLESLSLALEEATAKARQVWKGRIAESKAQAAGVSTTIALPKNEENTRESLAQKRRDADAKASDLRPSCEQSLINSEPSTLHQRID